MMKTLWLSVLTIAFSSCNILGQSKQIGEIPFTINANGLIQISLYINEEKVSKFILDTGASVTVLDDDIASKLNLELEVLNSESIGASGVVNDRKKTEGQQITIVENVDLQEIPLHVRDLSHLGEFNGIIGFDLFRNFVSEIDFDNRKVVFYKKKGKPDTQGYKAIKFVETYCTPEVDVSFSMENGEIFSGKALFDTGNTASPLIINSPYDRENELKSKFSTLLTSESKGINAKAINEKGVIKSLEMGGFGLGEMPVIISSAEKGVLSWEGYMGLLGLEYISKFNFIIDYHRKRIHLKPNKNFSKSFKFPLSGISFKDENDEVFISLVAESSDAYDQGLRSGQKLVSINGIKGESRMFYKNLLKQEGEEVVIIVSQKNGELKTIKITLKRLI